MDERTFDQARTELLSLIERSPIPEDSGHAVNTLAWVKKLRTDAGPTLALAALGHDIERAFPARRVRQADFADFDSYKAAHSANSGRIIAQVLGESRLTDEELREIHEAVALHEFGGTERSNILKWADSLSFFDNNLELYARRHTRDEIEARVRWGLRRLPAGLRETASDFVYESEDLADIVRRTVRQLR